MNSYQQRLYNLLPAKNRETIFLRLFGFLKIPMLFFLGPSVVELSDIKTVVKIPLGLRSKNHLGSMYFGALAAGADCAGGLMAMKLIELSGHNVSLVFKDFYAKFGKRAHGDVLFTCTQGVEVAELVKKAIASREREELTMNILATCPSQGEEMVAEFKLTLSLKRRD